MKKVFIISILIFVTIGCQCHLPTDDPYYYHQDVAQKPKNSGNNSIDLFTVTL